jgi:hypothetical protein
VPRLEQRHTDLAAFAVARSCRRGVAGRVDRPAEEGGGGREAAKDREGLPPYCRDCRASMEWLTWRYSFDGS